eukprot:gene3441-3769_t
MTTKDGKPMQIISEGTAHMHYDPNETVFYNKVQVLNRDLSIQVIKLYSEKLMEEKIARLEKRQSKATDSFDLPTAKAEIEQGVTILDALAASGLRSIRYLKEIPHVKHLTINDLSSTATDLAVDNCQRNSVDQSKVIVSNQDAIMLMYSHREPTKRFDVIDLDPYGSAAPFLDGTVQAVANGGLLCVTCTDMTALAGAYPEVCFSKYGSVPVKAKFNHEMGLRILLHAIDSTANKYKRHIVPWLSLSVDFYVRVFVRVYESAAEVKNSCLRRAMVLQCTQSPTFVIHPLATRKFHNKAERSRPKQKKGQMKQDDADADKSAAAVVTEQEGEEKVEAEAKDDEIVGGAYNASILRASNICEDTGANMKVGGPFWSEPIHKQEIVDELLRRVETYLNTPRDPAVVETDPIPTARRLGGILSSMSDELKDVPLYYSLPDLASTAQIKVPTIAEVQAALASAGYRHSQFHHDPYALKTDAPSKVVWDIIRSYAKIHPPVFSAKRGQSAISKYILSQEITTKVDFTHSKRVTKGLARFPPNPEANWGPKRRAGKNPVNQEGASVPTSEDASQNEVEMETDGNEVEEPEHKRCKKEEEKI